MIADLKPYPKMKDSGVPWLGAVPEYWDVVPHRAVFTEVKERDHPDEEMLSVTITRGVIKQAALLADTSKKDSSNLDKSAYKLVTPGDLAYNKMRAWQGAIGVSELRGIISPAYVVQRPSERILPRFAHHLLRTPGFAKEAERWSYGITSDMWSLRPEHFRLIYTCVPPLDEQAAIVRFLDHADRRIRRYIRAKQKLIKLLEEQKQAIIHRAVTRGLDPNVRLKPSGVEWLGDVPEHWEVHRLKSLTTRIEQGWSPQCDAQPAAPDEWGVLKVGCVNREAFDQAQNKKLPAFLEPPPELEVREGDILISRANTRQLLGLAALVEGSRRKLLLCDKLFRFRADPAKLIPRFLVHLIRSRPSRAQIESATNGASDSMQNIGQAVIKNLFIAVPPLGEQQAILQAVASEVGPINQGISEATHIVALLQEYRTRIIADVVTGKLDVRGVATSVPAGGGESDDEFETVPSEIEDGEMEDISEEAA